MSRLLGARVLGATGSGVARIMVVLLLLIVAGTPQATGQDNEPSPAATASDRSAAIVRFVDLLGGEAAIEQRGDIELTGRQLGPGSERWRWRGWLRRRPFAVREEFTPADEAGDALGPTAVFVTTEHRAWRLDDISESVAGETTEADSGVPKPPAREPAPGAALEDSAAIAALDSAFGLRLLLWPADAATRTIAQEPGPVPPAPGLVDDSIAGQLSSTLLIAAPSGRSWLAFFDGGVGVPIALADPFSPDQDWVRFTQWPILESVVPQKSASFELALGSNFLTLGANQDSNRRPPPAGPVRTLLTTGSSPVGLQANPDTQPRAGAGSSRPGQAGLDAPPPGGRSRSRARQSGGKLPAA